MKDEAMHNETAMRGSSTGSRLRLPVQAAPIDRTAAGAALRGSSGVEPAIWGALAGALAPVAIDFIRKQFG